MAAPRRWAAAPAATATTATSATTTASATAAAAAAAAARMRGAAHRDARDHALGEQLRGDRQEGDLVADVGLDVRKGHRVLLAGEADGIALGPGPRGAADAVHVVGGVLGRSKLKTWLTS